METNEEVKECSWKHYVRPFAVLSTLIFFMVLAVIDGKYINVKEPYLKILDGLLTTLVLMYFGSRGFEKISYHIGNKNINMEKTKEN